MPGCFSEKKMEEGAKNLMQVLMIWIIYLRFIEIRLI